MEEFMKWLKECTCETVGDECSKLALQLTKLYDLYNKERTQDKKIYVWHNYVTTDEMDMDDIIFNVLASRADDVRYAENHLQYEWDNVEEYPYDAEEYLKWLNNGYKKEV